MAFKELIFGGYGAGGDSKEKGNTSINTATKWEHSIKNIKQGKILGSQQRSRAGNQERPFRRWHLNGDLNDGEKEP